jgi:predicted nucleotidyltransferase
MLDERNLLVGPLQRLFADEDALSARVFDWLRMTLENVPFVTEAYVFGSAARGQMTADSDIDLAVVSSDAVTSTVGDRLAPVLDEFRARVGAPVQLIVTSRPPTTLRGGPRRLWSRILKEGVQVKAPPKSRGRSMR